MKGEKQAFREALQEISDIATFNGMLSEEQQAHDMAFRLGRAGAVADEALNFSERGGPRPMLSFQE